MTKNPKLITPFTAIWKNYPSLAYVRKFLNQNPLIKVIYLTKSDFVRMPLRTQKYLKERGIALSIIKGVKK